jgi:SAM-dependent MidA family methyltransferase
MQPSTTPCDPLVLAALRERAGGKGELSFAEFMEVALYGPGVGYYRRDRTRVGYGEGTDFLTATASAPLFGKLAIAACGELLGGAPLSSYDFVEVGAEPGAGILAGAAHPFRSVRELRIGDPLTIEGPSVVFSNELFDAQPFRRFRRRGGAWREIGVSTAGEGLFEIELASAAIPQLPEAAPEGYVVDAPVGASTLAGLIAAQPWTGLFLAFDYGKSWEEIAFATPSGTARSYRRHVQGNTLLAHAGDQDLTCHVCWDWLADALREQGFGEPRVESQEAFFALHCGPAIGAVTASEAGRLSRDKLSLLQLLHPAHMGQRFQVLWAVRRDAKGRPADPHPDLESRISPRKTAPQVDPPIGFVPMNIWSWVCG